MKTFQVKIPGSVFYLIYGKRYAQDQVSKSGTCRMIFNKMFFLIAFLNIRNILNMSKIKDAYLCIAQHVQWL
jgi:hypothetical protein